MINTKFWDDAYSSNLDPIEKLLFLYFLTNTSSNICGIYEIPLKKIANETGIDKDMVEKVISRFEKDHKIYYREGWLGLVNFIKNQNQNSPKVKKGIEIEMEKAPEIIKNLVLGKGIDTLSHSNSNSNLNSNLTKPNIDIVASDKSVFGEFKNVLLKEEEYTKLISTFGEKNTIVLIEELSGYMASKRKKYASHYATLLNWGRRKIQDYKNNKKNKTFIV